MSNYNDDATVVGWSLDGTAWNAMTTVIDSNSAVSSGAGVPSSTPSKLGNIYIDTTNKKQYIAMGTSSSSDWKKVLIQ